MTFRPIVDPDIAAPKRRGRPPKAKTAREFSPGEMRRFVAEARAVDGPSFEEMTEDQKKEHIKRICEKRGWSL